MTKKGMKELVNVGRITDVDDMDQGNLSIKDCDDGRVFISLMNPDPDNEEFGMTVTTAKFTREDVEKVHKALGKWLERERQFDVEVNQEIEVCQVCHWTKQEGKAARLNGVWVCFDCMKRIIQRHKEAKAKTEKEKGT